MKEPYRCNFCNTPLTHTRVDGKTQAGPWADMCENCHKKYGVGFGMGKGQLFDVHTGKKLEG